MRQRACADEPAEQAGPDVPSVAGQSAVDGGVDDQHPVGVVGGPDEPDAGLPAHGAGAAVSPHDVAGGDGVGAVRGGDRRGDGVGCLGEFGEIATVFDGAAERGEAVVQGGVGAMLRDQPGVGVRHAGIAGVGAAQHSPRHGDRPEVEPHQRIGGAAGQHVVEDAEVVENLQGAGLDALGAGSVEPVLGPVDDADGESAADEIDRQRGADGACADDENVDVVGVGGGRIVRHHRSSVAEIDHGGLWGAMGCRSVAALVAWKTGCSSRNAETVAAIAHRVEQFPQCVGITAVTSPSPGRLTGSLSPTDPALS